MAVITAPVSNPALVTNGAASTDNTLNVDGLFPPNVEYARIYLYDISAPLQFNVAGVCGSGTPTFTTTNNGTTLGIKKGNLLHINGAAGNETFKMSLVGEMRFQGLGAE